ncbi:MAG: hypothetical protein IPM12_12700 [Flavobacteriales bacterium]|nr:hypothetical protein [Flavobacteriales bacterium]
MRFTWGLPVLLIGCTAPDPGNARIIGHGGSGPEADWPMNSEQSLRAALDLGIDGIELDAQLTADGVLLAYHESDLSELTACSGKVNAHPWEMLQACAVIDANARFPLVRIDSLLVGLAACIPMPISPSTANSSPKATGGTTCTPSRMPCSSWNRIPDSRAGSWSIARPRISCACSARNARASGLTCTSPRWNARLNALVHWAAPASRSRTKRPRPAGWKRCEAPGSKPRYSEPEDCSRTAGR